jgi:hypothetical protein
MKMFGSSLTALASAALLTVTPGSAAQPPSPGRAELKNLVERSYQYVALYNTLLGFALNEKNPFSTHGWNKTYKPTAAMDHTVRVIAAPQRHALRDLGARHAQGAGRRQLPGVRLQVRLARDVGVRPLL